MHYDFSKITAYTETRQNVIAEFLRSDVAIKLLSNNDLDGIYSLVYKHGDEIFGLNSNKIAVSILTEFFYKIGIDILDYVTKIHPYCFYNTFLKRVEIPNTITEICNFAFYSTDIEEVVIPGSVKKVGKSAFEVCSKLKNVDIQEGVKELCSDCIDGIHKGAGIYLPSTLTRMGDIMSLFYETSITFFVKEGSYAQERCESLEYNYYTV